MQKGKTPTESLIPVGGTQLWEGNLYCTCP